MIKCITFAYYFANMSRLRQYIDRLFTTSAFGYLSDAIVVLSALYSFAMIFFGVDFADTFYYISRFHFDKVRPMIIGFQSIGWLWVTIFGDSVLALRIANWLLFAASFYLVCRWFVPRRFRALMALPFLLLPTLSLNIFNGDAVTLLMLLLFVRADMLVRDNRGLWADAAVSAIVFVLVSCRFPNILMLGFVFVLKVALDRRHLFRFVLQMLVAGLFLTILYALLWSMGYHIVGEVVPTDHGHDLPNLIHMMKGDTPLFATSFVAMLAVLLPAMFHTRWRVANVVLALLPFCAVALILHKYVPYTFACWDFAVFYSAFISALLVSVLVMLVVRRQWQSLYLPLIMLLLATIPPAGSDTGFLKFAWFFMVIAPYAVYSYQEAGSGYRIWPVAFYIAFASIAYHCDCPLEEPEITNVRYTIDSPMLRGIRTGATRSLMVQSMRGDFAQFNLDDKPVVFYGQWAHGCYAIFNRKPLFETTFAMRCDCADDLASLSACIDESHPVVYLVPEFIREIMWDTPVKQLLADKGYTEVCREARYILYMPTDSINTETEKNDLYDTVQ